MITPAVLAVLCCVVFHSLEGRLLGSTSGPVDVSDLEGIDKLPMFVSYHQADGTLRACKGSTSPRTGLEPTAASLALKHDTRFDAISADEIETLMFDAISADEIETLDTTVSVLHSFKDVSDDTDWLHDEWFVLGEEGIRMSITIPAKGKKGEVDKYAALYLPHVPVAEGRDWDHKTTLARLLKKSKCPLGLKDALKKGTIHVETFRSDAETMTYKEYKQRVETNMSML
ncbi:alpha-methylacyl?CoA racemase 1 [Kipferlia bialata]|uniref:Alpha-methylacyl?CoA racemase 1 n=1 Tax=Kipferlia bialata TaxID=797122 RepID=A0A9K3GGR8_9EUKA|nr:alpha-methylacyl?CoA racemase 1 [Kipferlia bialata]|eukprot:g3576.t1